MDGDVKIFPDRRIGGASMAPRWRRSGATRLVYLQMAISGARLASSWRHDQCIRIPKRFCGASAGFRCWEMARPLRLIANFQGRRRAQNPLFSTPIAGLKETNYASFSPSMSLVSGEISPFLHIIRRNLTGIDSYIWISFLGFLPNLIIT